MLRVERPAYTPKSTSSLSSGCFGRGTGACHDIWIHTWHRRSQSDTRCPLTLPQESLWWSQWSDLNKKQWSQASMVEGSTPLFLRYASKPRVKSGSPLKWLVPITVPKAKRLLVTQCASAHNDAGHKSRKVPLHHICLEEVDQDYVALNPVPPQKADLLISTVAKQCGDHLGHPPEVLVIPLSISGQQLSEWPWIFHPVLAAHWLLLEEAAVQVEVEHPIWTRPYAESWTSASGSGCLDELQDWLEFPPSGELQQGCPWSTLLVDQANC